MITGDKKVLAPGTEAYARLELQRSVVEDVVVVHWGRGSFLPRIPKGTFDVITVQDPFWRGLFALYAARLLHVRLNVQVHADLVAQSFIKRCVATFVLQRADSVRTVSEKVKRQVEGLHVRAPIRVLPIYLDVSRFRAIVHEPHAQKTILWVGRFEIEKDPLAAITVLERVRKAGVDAKLIMLGAGSMERVLKTKAAGSPIEFPGWQDPAAFLSQADVVLCTSREESWGASTVEALAAGVAVVAPDVGIAREAGAIVVPRQELAQAVIKALQSNTSGDLKLTLLSQEEWACAWKESLI